jgi:hypothetical protein
MFREAFGTRRLLDFFHGRFSIYKIDTGVKLDPFQAEKANSKGGRHVAFWSRTFWMTSKEGKKTNSKRTALYIHF